MAVFRGTLTDKSTNLTAEANAVKHTVVDISDGIMASRDLSSFSLDGQSESFAVKRDGYEQAGAISNSVLVAGLGALSEPE